MKTSFVFIFAVAVLALAKAETGKEEAHRIVHECQAADALTPRSLCMHVKFGYMKENGDIDENKFRASLTKMPRLDDVLVDDIVEHCGKRNGSTAGEAAEALEKCIKERIVIHRPGTTFRN